MYVTTMIIIITPYPNTKVDQIMNDLTAKDMPVEGKSILTIGTRKW